MTSPDTHPSSSALRRTLQAEGLAIGVVCTVLYAQTGMGWGAFALLLLVPDVMMLGYLAGNRWGALCYNLGHSLLGPVALALLAHALHSDMVAGLALIWGAHIGFDRAMGYGLKYACGFKATHLNAI